MSERTSPSSYVAILRHRIRAWGPFELGRWARFLLEGRRGKASRDGCLAKE